jgi:hypothetical protein
VSAVATLAVKPLRRLTVDPKDHPRGQHHLSAASGLVCALGRVYVIADDEHHLAVFKDLHAPGQLHRLFPGDLPEPKKARKRLKPDLETLLLLPAQQAWPHGALLALGSGSRENRHTGVLVPLRENGEPWQRRVQRFDLTPLYAPLRGLLGEINIEGAMVIGSELVLLHRGGTGSAGSAALHYPLRSLLHAADGQRSSVKPTSTRHYRLGAIDGVELGFTDGAALPSGGWVFTAVAESRDNAVADGPCLGSAVGVADTEGRVAVLRRLVRPFKVEGIAAHVSGGATTLCMVTDADDPAQSSVLLLARM